MLTAITVTAQPPTPEGSALLGRAAALAQAIVEILVHDQPVPLNVGFVLARVPDGQDRFYQHSGDRSLESLVEMLEEAGATGIVIVSAAYIKVGTADSTTSARDQPYLCLHLAEVGGIHAVDYVAIVEREGGYTLGDTISVNAANRVGLPYRVPKLSLGPGRVGVAHRLH
ncbi:hypothetical protein [Rhodanobacter sp. FW106-PBR-LB-2-11]|uniref:hypothetical protein n=1 Tax=Rhodanobacter sp. FW106-PBR-LB-2-11 TaxID=1524463 RepID=UPI0034E556F9